MTLPVFGSLPSHAWVDYMFLAKERSGRQHHLGRIRGESHLRWGNSLHDWPATPIDPRPRPRQQYLAQFLNPICNPCLVRK